MVVAVFSCWLFTQDLTELCYVAGLAYLAREWYEDGPLTTLSSPLLLPHLRGPSPYANMSNVANYNSS